MPHFLIHGWATTSAIWPDWLLTSKTHSYQSPTFPDYSHLEREFLTFYQEQNKPVTMIGWSLGGMLTLELAASHPDKIRKIILISSTPRFTLHENYKAGLDPMIIKSLARKLTRSKLQTQADFYRLMFSTNESSWTEAFSLQIAPFFFDIDLTTLQEGLRYLLEKDLRNLLSSIQPSCHIIHGTKDTICPPEAAQYMANALPNSTLTLVPSAGHIPFYTHGEYCKPYLHSSEFFPNLQR